MTVEFNFHKVILGGSLESLLYSFVTETPLVISTPIVPFELESTPYDHDFKFLGYDHNREIYKSEMWDRLSFILSMAGLVVMPNTIRNVRQEKKKLIFATTGNSRTIISYDKLISFDKPTSEFVHTYDWFDIRSGSKIIHDDLIDTTDDLVKRVYFYKSRRRGQNGDRKDLVSYSILKTPEIHDYENSHSYVRLKTLSMMKEAGLRGTPNGYNKRGTPLYYAIKIEHTHREIIKDYKPKYTLAQIIKKRKREGDVWNLAKKLFRHKQISILRESFRLPDKV